VTAADPAADLGRAIAACYRAVAEGAMAGMPVCNPALGVADVGFRPHAGQAIGIVVTPWFMNVVAARLPDAPRPPSAAPGAIVRAALPGGEIDMIVGDLDGFGRIDACSLFSPMQNFADMDAALEAARAAMAELFARAADRRAGAARDRRAFLSGRRAARAP